MSQNNSFCRVAGSVFAGVALACFKKIQKRSKKDPKKIQGSGADDKDLNHGVSLFFDGAVLIARVAKGRLVIVRTESEVDAN